jgi:hypothetical protein
MKRLIIPICLIAALVHAQTPGVMRQITATNDTSTGTATGNLALINSSGNAITATTAATAAQLYLPVSGAGTSGSVAMAGPGSEGPCQADATGYTKGHYVQLTVTTGRCTDVGTTLPTSGWYGQAQTTAAANATGTVLNLGVAASSGASAVQSVTITLSASQVTNLFTTPQPILAALGTGTVIEPVDIFINFVYAGALFTCGHNFGLGYSSSMADSAYNMSPVFATSYSENTVIEFTASQSAFPLATNGTAATATVVNKGLYIGSSTANCTGGAGASIVVTMLYQVISGVQ